MLVCLRLVIGVGSDVQGGFSEVHLAHDKVTGKTVALKVVFLNKGGLTKDQVRRLHGGPASWIIPSI